ncbi:VOC family protein [Duganella vulcania]|uniref:VOC family protein n=1 Tax=Duganella vulcania TaxID=2692166 RepID=UPI0020C21961|nr:hypothetical protein [Duganella vulcania]
MNAFVCTVDVDNLDDMLVQVAALKAEVAVPKTAIPGIGRLAYIKDHDGNQNRPGRIWSSSAVEAALRCRDLHRTFY